MDELIYRVITYFTAILGVFLSIAKIIDRINKHFGKITWKEVDKALNNLVGSIYNKKYIPDIIIGIGKGGSVASGMISAALNYIPIYHVDRIVKFRIDGTIEEMKIVIPGVIKEEIVDNGKMTNNKETKKETKEDTIIEITIGNVVNNKKVLLVNGQSNSGSTILFAKQILSKEFRPKEIKTCALIALTNKNANKIEIKHEPDFCGLKRKRECYFPWEEKGKNRATSGKN